MPHKIDITHPEKILYPSLNLSKEKIIEFYQEISPYLLPHLKHRPIVLQRFTEGVEKEGFFQQEIPDYYPDWMKGISVERKEKGTQKMLEVHTKTALKYVVNQDGICFHTWLSQKGHLDKPDYIVYDLDPSGNDFSSVVEVAYLFKEEVEKLKGTPFVMTTGSAGLHVMIPIKVEYTFDKNRELAKKLAEKIVKKHPDKVTTNVRKDQREGKIFLDYLRNSYGQTTISPYSLRAKENAPIATPLEWEELSDSSLNSQTYTIKNILKRLSQKEDPWKQIARSHCSIENLL
ncbi:MAG: non-homologous end-joining DNA ligase [Chlamydiales bacterium]